MEYKYSNRIAALKPSAIREILKVTQDPTVISFAAGNPAVQAFPAEEMAEIAADIFAGSAGEALQYGISEGYGPLREITASRLKEKYATGGNSDDLIIVSGGQQGIELTAKVLVNEGDTIICEDPSFIGSLNAFRSYKVNLKGVSCDGEGIDTDEVEKILKSDSRVKMIYVIPTFQNPTGATMSLARRKKLLEIAKRYNTVILEDSPYFELRYGGDFIPSIKSMDDGGNVVYVGSYSKIISPGMRVGFVCAPKELISKITVAKQVSDVHTNLFFMMLVTRYLHKYDIDAHIAKIRALYKSKRDRMADNLIKYCRQASWNVPDGGLFLWVTLPQGSDGFKLCKIAGAKKVAAVPGSSFSVDESRKVAGIRLNFSLPEHEQIDRGCELLGEAMNEYFGG